MRALLPLGLLLLGGCAQSLVAVLPPEEGGTSGGIAIIDETSNVAILTLDKPNTQAGLRGAIAIKPLDITKGDVGALLETMPRPPRKYVLYFRDGSAELAEGSDILLQEFFADVASRPGSEVLVIGHTDTMGPQDMNDMLSLRRAESLVQLLVQRGLNRDIAQAIGRGEREPAVNTGDEVPDPLNRRIEIIVR